MTACLVAESGFATSLQQKVVRVGSDPMAEIPFAGISGLAPFHFEITSTGQGHSIRQLQVIYPLLVNGQPLTTARLADGDVISAGSLNLIYGSEVPDIPAPSPVTILSDDEFVSRLTETPPETRCRRIELASDTPSLRPALLAAVVSLLVTTIAYSFVCNFTWPFFILAVLLLGHAVGRMFRMAGDGRDMRFGQMAALVAVAGVVAVNSLTAAGIMNMFEIVSAPPASAAAEQDESDAALPEAGQGSLGTGRAALDLTSDSLVETWRKFIPWESISGQHARAIPVTDLKMIMFGPKSLLASLLIMITAYSAAFQSRPRTSFSTVAGSP